MVTCRQLMELDIFHNVKLKAGRKGLDRAVSWVYAKHTKTITEWVHGREFILVSGYEYGIDEAELLKLIEEAAQNNLSGILVEGGINFKEMPASVIKKADEKELPLFFCTRGNQFFRCDPRRIGAYHGKQIFKNTECIPVG